jgi:hypothetical protein
VDFWSDFSVFCHWENRILKSAVKSALDRDYVKIHNYDCSITRAIWPFLSLSLSRRIEPCTEAQFLDLSWGEVSCSSDMAHMKLGSWGLYVTKYRQLLPCKTSLYLFKEEGKSYLYVYPYLVIRSHRSFSECLILYIYIYIYIYI